MRSLEPELEKLWIAPRRPIAVTVRIATTLRRMPSLLWEFPPFAFPADANRCVQAEAVY
jgi:hypothetical protein